MIWFGNTIWYMMIWYYDMIYDGMILRYGMMIGYDGLTDRLLPSSTHRWNIRAPSLLCGRRSTRKSLGWIFFQKYEISKHIKITDYRFVTFWKPSAAEYIAYSNLNNKAFVPFEGKKSSWPYIVAPSSDKTISICAVWKTLGVLGSVDLGLVYTRCSIIAVDSAWWI